MLNFESDMTTHLFLMALSFLGREMALLQVGEGDSGRWLLCPFLVEKCSLCSIDLGLDMVC